MTTLLIAKKASELILRPLSFASRLSSTTSSDKEVRLETESSKLPEEDDHMPVPNMENPFQKEKQQCILCRLKIRPDYKNPKLLSQFMSQYTGRVYGRHITGLCKRKQEEVEKEITKSQKAGFMPTYMKDPVFTRDPKLFSPETPFRPHPF